MQGTEPELDRPENQTGVPQIEVTPEMIEAGMDELSEHAYTGDLKYMIECVFRAMAYVSPQLLGQGSAHRPEQAQQLV